MLKCCFEQPIDVIGAMALRSGTTWFEQVPKVELHLHLEGAIPHEALW